MLQKFSEPQLRHQMGIHFESTSVLRGWGNSVNITCNRCKSTKGNMPIACFFPQTCRFSIGAYFMFHIYLRIHLDLQGTVYIWAYVSLVFDSIIGICSTHESIP